MAKAVIDPFFYELIPDNIFGNPEVTRTQRSIFELIFKTAMKKMKFENKSILSVDPVFFGKSKALHYLVRSSSKIATSAVLDEMKLAFNKYKSLLLIVSPKQKSTVPAADMIFKGVAFEWIENKRFK